MFSLFCLRVHSVDAALAFFASLVGVCVFASLPGCFVWFVVTKRGKGVAETTEGSYSSELGWSKAMDRFLATLVDEGWLPSMEVVRSLSSEIMLTPRNNAAVVFSAFFDVGFRIPSVPLVVEVLGIYQAELAQLTPNSIAHLSIFEWAMQSLGVEGSGGLFAFLHDARHQLKETKGTNTVVNFGTVNFEGKPSRQQYMPTPASKNRWETDWVKWIDYTTTALEGLHSSGKSSTLSLHLRSS